MTTATKNMNASILIANTLNTVVPAWSGLNIDPSKSSFIELFTLLNKEYKTYKGMANYQAENGDIHKALRYQDIECELHKVIRATSHLAEGKPARRLKKVKP